MIRISEDICDNCEACVMVCPAEGIFFMDKIIYTEKNCNYCKRCEIFCPLGAIIIEINSKNHSIENSPEKIQK